MAVIENEDEIKFLRKIVSGGAKKSFGIAVAKLSGLPSYITDKAEKHLSDLMKEDKNNNA